jgi:hypothetical protein
MDLKTHFFVKFNFFFIKQNFKNSLIETVFEQSVTLSEAYLSGHGRHCENTPGAKTSTRTVAI